MIFFTRGFARLLATDFALGASVNQLQAVEI
jgi:hypothetical protein